MVSRIIEEDVRIFIDKANRPELMAEEIKRRLPAKYCDLYEAFLLYEANVLPPHRSYDHKIELIPGSKPPSAWNRPLLPIELYILKR